MAGPFDSAADEIDARGAIYDRRLAGRLLRFLVPYRKEVVLSVVLLAAISLLEVAGPYLTKVAIDTYVMPASGRGAFPSEASRGLLLIAVAYVGVLAAAFGLRYFQSYMMSMVGQRAMRDLRLDIFRHLGTLTPSYYDTRPVGQILTRVTQDVSVLNELFSQGVVAVLGDLFILFGIVGAMLWLDWRLALVTLTTVPLLFLATAVFRAYRAMDDKVTPATVTLGGLTLLLGVYILDLLPNIRLDPDKPAPKIVGAQLRGPHEVHVVWD